MKRLLIPRVTFQHNTYSNIWLKHLSRLQIPILKYNRLWKYIWKDQILPRSNHLIPEQHQSEFLLHLKFCLPQVVIVSAISDPLWYDHQKANVDSLIYTRTFSQQNSCFCRGRKSSCITLYSWRQGVEMGNC